MMLEKKTGTSTTSLCSVFLYLFAESSFCPIFFCLNSCNISFLLLFSKIDQISVENAVIRQKNRFALISWIKSGLACPVTALPFYPAMFPKISWCYLSYVDSNIPLGFSCFLYFTIISAFNTPSFPSARANHIRVLSYKCDSITKT